jgi:AraC family transcriptional regulator
MKPVPEIVTLPERFFAGLKTGFITQQSPEANNMVVIPRLWSEFCPRVQELATNEPDVFYGLCACPATLGETASHPHEAFYLAAVQVSKGAPTPAGMTTWASWSGHYAKFTHRGRIEGIGETMSFIYAKWLPASAYVHADAPDLERYGVDFDPHSDTSELEIYIPVCSQRAATATG